MKSNQKLAIMFWLKNSKATKDGMAPLYARITISGKYEDISLSRKVNPKFWDSKLKRDTEPSAAAKATNQKIAVVESELENHFILLRSQHEDVTPSMLKNSYLGLPVKFNGSVAVSKRMLRVPPISLRRFLARLSTWANQLYSFTNSFLIKYSCKIL